MNVLKILSKHSSYCGRKLSGWISIFLGTPKVTSVFTKNIDLHTLLRERNFDVLAWWKCFLINCNWPISLIASNSHTPGSLFTLLAKCHYWSQFPEVWILDGGQWTVVDTDKNKLTSLKVAPLAPNHHWLTYHRRCQCIWKIGLGTILDIFHFPSFWCNSLLSKEFVSSPLHPQMRATLEMVFEVGNSKLAFFPANSMFPILNIISLLNSDKNYRWYQKFTH